MSSDFIARRPGWGFSGFVFGLIALAIVCFHVSAIFAEPQPKAATTIGEMAAEIRQSATRAMLGQPQPEPEPEAQAWGVTRYLALAAPILAGVAALLGGIGLLRREAPLLPGIAIACGIGAIFMQYAFWLVLLIGGIFLVIAIINNLDSILGG